MVSELTDYRFPIKYDGLQLNSCSDVNCENFGIDPVNFDRKSEKALKDKRYRIVGIGKKIPSTGLTLTQRGFQCKICGLIGTVHSNIAAMEEKNRLLQQFINFHQCKNEKCDNHQKPLEVHPNKYSLFGTTDAGSKRYKCKSCKKTFSISNSSTHRLRQPDKTVEIFRLLINKVPMRRICEIANVSPSLIYQRIDFIYEVLKKHSHQEQLRIKDMSNDFLHFCTDRQEISLNWGTAFERNITVLKSIATAEMKSGFIIAQNLNFDPEIKSFLLDLEARMAGDDNLKQPYQKFARLWLPYQLRDSEVGSTELETSKAYTKGCMVREIYTQYGHFLYLNELLSNVDKLQFSIDPDSGIERAVLHSFKNRIENNTIQACLVKTLKKTTVTKKQTLLAIAEKEWEKMRFKFPNLPDKDLLKKIIGDQLKSDTYREAKNSQKWINHPIPTMNEPSKKIRVITRDEQGESIAALWAVARASLRSVDRYFMLVRRRISLFERPINSASSHNRAWYGYQAYSPHVAYKLLEIFRCAYNYTLQGNSKKSPAEKLGIIDKTLSLEELMSHRWD